VNHSGALGDSEFKAYNRIRSHIKTLYACDFFAVEILGAFGVVRYLVYVVVELKSRAVEIAGVADSRLMRPARFRHKTAFDFWPPQGLRAGLMNRQRCRALSVF
jgi:hypothetical protein